MVQKSGDTWKTLDHIWISNGKSNDQARVEIRVQFEEEYHES